MRPGATATTRGGQTEVGVPFRPVKRRSLMNTSASLGRRAHLSRLNGGSAVFCSSFLQVHTASLSSAAEAGPWATSGSPSMLPLVALRLHTSSLRLSVVLSHLLCHAARARCNTRTLLPLCGPPHRCYHSQIIYALHSSCQFFAKTTQSSRSWSTNLALGSVESGEKPRQHWK